MKKLLIALLFVFLLSCENDTEPVVIERTCWTCKFMFIGQISEKVYSYCNKSDIGLPGNGEITKEEIDWFEKTRAVPGVSKVECVSFKE